MSEEATIIVAVVLGVVAIALAWLALMMAGLESAVTRVTRANLNNLMIDAQTDGELSDFTRAKRVRKIHAIQQVVADRHAASGSCAFFRICANVLIGALVAVILSMAGQAWWIELLAGLAAALVVAFVSVLVRPRTAGSARPMEMLLKHASLVTFAMRATPFARRRGEDRATARGAEPSDDEELEKIQLEQGKAAIDRLVETNKFDPEVSEMLRNVLMLSDTLTREIMVPRTDMICIERGESLRDFLQLCSRSGFSRVPVIGTDIDDLRGVAYLKDAVRATSFNDGARTRTVESIMRKPMVVPESKPADDLFHEMQQTRNHVAMVCDEYGGIAGMVTIEDAIEQIVGELDDEHDRAQHAEPELIGERTWSMPARTSIAQLEEIFEIDLDEDDVDTVYGLLTKLLGRVPIVGASADTRGLRLTAVDSAGRRKKVSTIVVEPVPTGHDNGKDTKDKDHKDHDEEPSQEDDERKQGRNRS
ncbi:MAG: hemolysin family protein [Bifidobacterium sp.]|nr:hemolysin family protein [Bifidobacterium sp.]